MAISRCIARWRDPSKGCELLKKTGCFVGISTCNINNKSRLSIGRSDDFVSFRFTSRQCDASQRLCCESLSSFSFDAFGCGRCIHSAACSLAWRKTRQGGIEFSKVSGKHRGTFKIHWLSIHWNERTQAKPGLFGWVQKLFVEFALGWFQLFRCEQTIRSYWRLHWLRGEQHQTWHHIIIKLMGRPRAFWDGANGVLDASWCDEKATESCCCQWPWSPNLTADFYTFSIFFNDKPR